MRTYEITFSPTGGTQWIADVIMQELPGEKFTVSLLKSTTDYAAYEFCERDVCLFAVPSFGGRVPAIAAERIARMKGNHARAILVCAYGNRAYEDTLLELKNVVKEAGFVPVAAAALIAEHSIMRQFAMGRPDKKDTDEIKRFTQILCEKINSGENLPEVNVPGNQPYKANGTIPFIPETDDTCAGCGFCAKECPVGAIDAKAPEKTDAGKCISCMRCISICPQNARRIRKELLDEVSKKMEKAFAVRKNNEFF